MKSKITSSDQNRSFIETARRAQIIDCAILAIAELGYGQASLAQIAKRAGISAGVISYYFKGKDDLIREVVAHIYATGEAFVRPRVEGEPTARQMLAAFVAANIDFAGARPSYDAAMVEINTFARASRTAPPFDRAITKTRSGPLAEILEWGQKSGEFRTFFVPIMVDTILAAIDLHAGRLSQGADATGAELVTLFDLATRAASPPPGASL